MFLSMEYTPLKMHISSIPITWNKWKILPQKLTALALGKCVHLLSTHLLPIWQSQVEHYKMLRLENAFHREWAVPQIKQHWDFRTARSCLCHPYQDPGSITYSIETVTWGHLSLCFKGSPIYAPIQKAATISWASFHSRKEWCTYAQENERQKRKPPHSVVSRSEVILRSQSSRSFTWVPGIWLGLPAWQEPPLTTKPSCQPSPLFLSLLCFTLSTFNLQFTNAGLF